MAQGKKYNNPSECLVAVLAVIDTIDPSVEYIGDITIWRFRETAGASSPWGWEVATGRTIKWDDKPREANQDRQRDDKAQWQLRAIKVYDDLNKQIAAGEAQAYASSK